MTGTTRGFVSGAITALVVFVCGSALAAGRTVPAAGPAELRDALASARPGDTIVVDDGRLHLGGTIVVTAGGAAGQPVVVRARNRQGVVLVGDSRFLLDNVAHVVIEGFEFRSQHGPAVELRGCSRIRVTRNVFHLEDTKPSNWVLVTGSERHPEAMSGNNRIDHNLFEQKKVVGNFITIEGRKDGIPQVSQFDTIDHNHFRDIGPRIENALEAIRIGNARLSLSSGFTLMEHNLFERCDGDPEYISIKSSDNLIRYNTFRECLGSLSLRHGNRNTVEGNFILGNGRTGAFTDSTGKTWTLGTGGVRFCGDSMVIINNYVEALTGKEWDATLAVTNGDAEYGDGNPLTKHFRIRDAVIAFNTFVNNAGGVEIGYDGGGFQGNRWPLPPLGLTFANNIIVGSADTLIRMFAVPEGSVWEGNIAFASKDAVVAAATIPGVEERDPQLVETGELWRPATAGPAIDRAVGTYPAVTLDMDGQERGPAKDVGADEVSATPARNRPLTARDVGPDAP